MNIKIKSLLACLVGVLIMSSCGGEQEDKLVIKNTEDTTHISPTMEIAPEVINEIMESIPSPIEMATLLKDQGSKYDAAILNDVENASTYNTHYAKAFNMGTYSADLGYINIYEKTFSAISYLNTIKKLADDIKVGQFFDLETLQRMAKNNNNYDSLVYLSTKNFNEMDAYLREQKRSELSVLMISGAWMEGLHIACQSYKSNKKQELKEKIGYEKIDLDNILLILNAYKTDKYFAERVAAFEEIKKIYEVVKITTEYKKAETKEVDGQLVIVNNSTTSIEVSEEQVALITAKVEEVRARLILPKK